MSYSLTGKITYTKNNNMDDPKELERLKNYKPSIDDLKMGKPQSDKGAYLFGWICPRCQKVHSPFSLICDCPPHYIVSTGSTTELKQ